MIEAQVYKALGDPVRLEIVRRLCTRSTSSIGELSADLGLSRQGARKQLQVLVEAKIVNLKQHGRQTEVVLDKRALQLARTFIAKLEYQWDNRLNALKKHIEKSD